MHEKSCQQGFNTKSRIRCRITLISQKNSKPFFPPPEDKETKADDKMPEKGRQQPIVFRHDDKTFLKGNGNFLLVKTSVDKSGNVGMCINDTIGFLQGIKYPIKIGCNAIAEIIGRSNTASDDDGLMTYQHTLTERFPC